MDSLIFLVGIYFFFNGYLVMDYAVCVWRFNTRFPELASNRAYLVCILFALFGVFLEIIIRIRRD